MTDSNQDKGDQRQGDPRKGEKTQGPGFEAKDFDPYMLKDPETMALNFARALENLGKAASAWLGPRESGEIRENTADPVTDMVKTLSKGLRNETSALSLYAPRTIFNQKITGSRRFAAQDWEIERLRAIGKATGTTINDVVLAMCGGALRRYLLELYALTLSLINI